jgi:hypothetical protein
VAATDVPLDDSSRHLAWSRNTDRVFCPVDGQADTRFCYGPGTSGLARPGVAGTAAVSLTTDTRRFAVFATRCPECGSLQVTVDGRLRATVSLRSARTRYREMVYSTGEIGRTPSRHTLQLVAVATPNRYVVQVDAIRLTR